MKKFFDRFLPTETSPEPAPARYQLRAQVGDLHGVQIQLPGGEWDGTEEECKEFLDRLVLPTAPLWINGFRYAWMKHFTVRTSAIHCLYIEKRGS